MASGMRIEVDRKSAINAVNNAPGVEDALNSATQLIVSQANLLGLGYETPIWHDHKTGETKGGTAPEYAGDVRRVKKAPIGIVHPANYAAMKDNYLHNTLLKAKG